MLEKFLGQEKPALLKKWFRSILETYPEDTGTFLTREKDPFANPTGAALREGIEGIYDALQQQASAESFLGHLDRVIRIRSLQDYAASDAVAFVFLLKSIVRDALGKEARDPQVRKELAAFDARVDRVALQAFDVYVQCREKLYELRVKELRRHRDAAVNMLERSNILIEKLQKKHDEKP